MRQLPCVWSLLRFIYSIRDHAEQKLYQALGPYAAMKRSGRKPNLALIVAGCVAQQEGQALLRRIPELDVVLGPQYIPHLPAVLQQVAHGSQVVVTAPTVLQQPDAPPQRHNHQNHNHTGPAESAVVPDDFFTPPIRGHDVVRCTVGNNKTVPNWRCDMNDAETNLHCSRGCTHILQLFVVLLLQRAWCNVIYGCNEHCTYCVVPATRGMEQSRPMEGILSECLDLVAAGYKEVTLLGQNIDAYGRDMVPKRTFADLLEYLNHHIPTDQFRIRYVTSHPRYFSNRVIDAVANLDKVCECFHVPFQAGDDAVLRAMRRGYTHDSYLRIIDRIRAQAPDSAICGDVIVGFPGETEEAFLKTLDLMNKVKFDNLNTFAYSPRPNTEASLWSNQVPEHVKAERLQRVQELAKQHGLERSQRYLGRTVQVLVEDANPRNPQEQVMGRTRQGRQVYFDGALKDLRGEFVQVRITHARTWSLLGELVSTTRP